MLYPDAPAASVAGRRSTSGHFEFDCCLADLRRSCPGSKVKQVLRLLMTSCSSGGPAARGSRTLLDSKSIAVEQLCR